MAQTSRGAKETINYFIYADLDTGVTTRALTRLKTGGVVLIDREPG